MKFRCSLVIGAVVLSALALAAFDGFSIKPIVKVGDVHKYKMTGKFELGGMEYEYSATSTQKILKVDASGSWTQKEDVSDIKLNGEEPPGGAGPGGAATTFSPKGEVQGLEGENIDATAYRSANLAMFIYPDADVKAGDTWTYDIKADAKKGIVACKATFTLVGEDKVGAIDTYKVKFLAKEVGTDAAASEGTIWINKADGSVVKYTTKWTNMPVPGAPVPISGDVSLVLVP